MGDKPTKEDMSTPSRRPGRGIPEPEIELRADGWKRFERAVDAAIASGPKHREAGKKPAKTLPANSGQIRGNQK
jgi:hypothetical protein